MPHHSVIMLNFCPDLQSVQPNPRKAHGEFIFLIDRSSSMSKTSIQYIKVLCVGLCPRSTSAMLSSAWLPEDFLFQRPLVQNQFKQRHLNSICSQNKPLEVMRAEEEMLCIYKA